MTGPRGLFIVVSLILVSMVASATEVSYPPLTLKKSYLKTSNDALFVTPTPAAAFTATSVTCPVTKPCVLQIQVSTQVSGLTPADSNVFVVEVDVDGSEVNVLPNSVLGFDSTSTGGASNARAFTWITTKLPPGKHSVTVEFFVAVSGGAASADRTLSIGVFQ